jgi:hypothetical protein
MRAHNALRYASGFCTAIAFLVPLAISIPIAMLLGIETSRGHERVMMVCCFFWLPILAPCWLLIKACDWLAPKIKPGKVQ